MSDEIVRVWKENATSAAKEIQHSFEMRAIEGVDILNPRTIFSPKVTIDLIGGDYHTKQFLASEKGHKYVKQINPTLESVKPLLDNVKEPSVLLLQGCESLLQSPGFPFHKFNSITALTISGCPHLNSLPESTISNMTRLQSLDLSYLQIHSLPDDLFINAGDALRSLVLKGCSNLHVLPELPKPLTKLEYLELSHLPIETVPVGFTFYNLRSLILRGCSKLHSLQLAELAQLHFLDLCGCTSLQTLKTALTFDAMVVDLSYTSLDWQHVPGRVSHLFFRNANTRNPITSYVYPPFIKVCDLSGSLYLEHIPMLENCDCLEALDLSRTRIESIGFLSGLTSLHTLLLRNCTKLKQLPTIEQLENLQVLDLSGCEILGDLPQGLSEKRRLKNLNLCGCKGLRYLREGLFNNMSSLEQLDLSNTYIQNLPSFDNLMSIGTVINYPDLSVPEDSHSTVPSKVVNLDVSGLDPLDSDNIGRLSEFHLVSTFITNSEFDKFIYKFTELNQYISFLEEKFTGATGVKGQFETMRADLEYILSKIDLLESSKNCRIGEDVVHELMSYSYYNYDDDHSSILKKLLRTVTKLKLLVPPPPSKSLSLVERWEKFNLPSPTAPYDMEKYFCIPDSSILLSAYESLTPIQRDCLLYFACIPVPVSGYFKIKDSTLIHLWYAEGFFDPLLYANSNDPDSKIEEIGREILQELQVTGFIYPARMNKRNERRMEKEAHSFVITKAMEENSFDFNRRRKLTPHFGVSRRACLLKSDIDHPPSSQVWLNYTKSSEQLESFKSVHTLLYIDEPVVDINKVWFSCMSNLQVLHLVNLYSEPINIVDLNFLEELENMKQLRFLNLEFFAAIQNLPDSICQLTNLRILSLKYCSNLMELPIGIASLTNLIILDLTQCHLLSQLPKGLASLSKLEILKGFPVTYKVGGRQSKKACTLIELLKLENLRKLNLVVNRDSFPNTMDLQVLRSMKELRNLKITWRKNSYKEEELQDAVEKGALRQSRWTQFKCWGPHNVTVEAENELLLENSSLGDLNKLVFCCFPSETEPNWLHPTELQNLERLYIEGGSLRTLFQGYTHQTTWNVKALKLKYLSNLHMDWSKLEANFPCVNSRGQHGCPHIHNFTRDTKDLYKRR